MGLSTAASRGLNDACYIASKYRHEFVTPEHLLLALMMQSECNRTFQIMNLKPRPLRNNIESVIRRFDSAPADEEVMPELSVQLCELLSLAGENAANAGVDSITVPHLISSMIRLEDSESAYLLYNFIGAYRFPEFLSHLYEIYKAGDAARDADEMTSSVPNEEAVSDESPYETKDEAEYDMEYDINGAPRPNWRSLVTCMNDMLEGRNPLIGREAELERTIQILCRKDKNNPLHVGEPGVGKTALVYGLARRIANGDIPDRLKGARIYVMDLGTMLAGTQYRGQFEERIKSIMNGLQKEENPIVYIDEIHNLIGAGQTSDGSMDASNMLKPYLENGKIRFIGSTTFDEYKRYFERSKGIVRRFQQMDILEPSVDEAIEILRQLKPVYESYHGVEYTDEAIEYAVRSSARHINGRFLPDKAIDLIDEAASYRQLHPLPESPQTVDRELIAGVLARICKVEKLSSETGDEHSLEALSTLSERMLGRIFGQDEAVARVTESVLIAKAGIEEETKPLASLLFVGPTGVGKTEVSKVLADELGVPLVRFDMSEYAEKHTVAKLIGAPAGYVGYEDGGLLTDAIRKNPECVLLLDEIEKAHQDIYNILLQVMDYASLTDNRGNKADFRNVILIMTSNAGAQHASKARVGFESRVTTGEAMMAQVKRTFKPEFLNRLTGTVIFRDMDRDMAIRIMDKKLGELARRLSARGVDMQLTNAAREWILSEAFTREYGAREFDRVISRSLKPVLMHAMLFGELRRGGVALVDTNDGKIIVTRKS